MIKKILTVSAISLICLIGIAIMSANSEYYSFEALGYNFDFEADVLTQADVLSVNNIIVYSNGDDSNAIRFFFLLPVNISDYQKVKNYVEKGLQLYINGDYDSSLIYLLTASSYEPSNNHIKHLITIINKGIENNMEAKGVAFLKE